MHLLYLLLAAIPLHLPVDISRPTSPAFPAYHGETLEIEAELKDRGTAFNVALTSPQLYYQTPGMGNSWWTLPATQTNNLLRATFPASADPGEDRLICFLGSAGDNFRAAFILNFRHSPGAVPNTVELPSPTLDFSQITILNSPYETIEAAASAHTNLTSQISAVQGDVKAVSNALVAAEADLSAQIAAAITTLQSSKQDAINDLDTIRAGAALGATALQSFTESDPTVPSWAKASTKPSYTLNEVAPSSENWLGVQGNAGRTIKILAQGAGNNPAGGVQVTASTLNNNNTTTYAYGGVAVKRGGTNTDYLWDASSQSGIVRRSELGDYATKTDVGSVSNKVSLLESWAIGDDLSFAVSDIGNPAAAIKISYTNDLIYSSAVESSNTVARANAYANGAISNLVDALDVVLDQKADRAWGNTTSDGAPAPADTLVIEKEKVSITGGGNYAYVQASVGGYWVFGVSLGSRWTLQSLADAQNPEIPSTIDLKDGDGSAVWTVTSTASRTVAAIVGEDLLAPVVTNAGDHDVVTINFPVTAASHPTLYYSPVVTNSLAEATSTNWPQHIASVAWSGSSGLFTATVTLVGKPGQGYFAAEYEKEGTTYTHYNKPIGFDQIVIGGTNYAVRVVNMNGVKVLGLEDLP